MQDQLKYTDWTQHFNQVYPMVHPMEGDRDTNTDS